MASILDGLNIAKMSLAANQYAISITQRNTANVNNPGYTRQDVFFKDPTAQSNWTTAGIPGIDVWSVRKSFLDHSIGQELPKLGESLSKYNALREIDTILQGTSGGGLGTVVSEFFNSFTQLSSNPTDPALRWQVITRAQTMTQEFNRLYNEIQRVQTSADRQISNGVNEANILTAKIADLNGRIEIAQASGRAETEFALRDERQQYIEELQSKMNALYFETESGSITVTTSSGDALVLGKANMQLTTGLMDDVYLSGNPITNLITSGEIGGHIQVRDKLIPGYLATFDGMAADIITEVNNIHANGFDLAGDAGGKFFESVTLESGVNVAVARDIRVVISDPSKVAAAGADLNGDTLGIGDNENAKALAIISEKSFNGNTLGEFYASLIYKVGSDQLAAKEAGEAQQSVLGQLLGRRDAASGVSLNEEAVNLIKFQQAYQASSRFVSVLNSLSAEILSILR